MTEYYVAGNSVSGVTEYAKNTAYSLGDKVVPNRLDTGTNHANAKRYVWECTTAGTTDATNYPSWDASYTPDSSTETSSTATFTCRNPGYSSGTTASWLFATLFLEYGFYAATGNGDIIYVDQGLQESGIASSTITLTAKNNINVICTNDTTNYPPQTKGSMGTTGFVGSDSVTLTILIAFASYKVLIDGITFRNAGTGTTGFNLSSLSNGHLECHNCYFWIGATHASARLTIGANANYLSYFKFKDCTFRFASTSQYIFVYNTPIIFDGGSISSSGSAPSVLFGSFSRGGGFIKLSGMDLSHITGTLFNEGISSVMEIFMDNCKLGSGVAVVGTRTVPSLASTSVTVLNCSSADEHYQLAHYNSLGQTTVDTGIYANDGASYDGTNRCSWKVVTTANCSYYTPYVSPWIDVYHSGTSAITPYLEILRSGSATAYQDDEVWAEFSYQGTSGSPLAIITSDRKAVLSAAGPLDQTTGMGKTSWMEAVGDPFDEADTAWSGKLHSKLTPTDTITPAEIGHLRARVCVGEPSITVYVDPTIRGRS